MPADPKPDFDALVKAADEAKAARAEAMPDDTAALVCMFTAWQRLKELGWREAMYAPCDSSPLLLIESGSTGTHEGYCDPERRFWAYCGGDLWPSNPCLFKVVSDAR